MFLVRFSCGPMLCAKLQGGAADGEVGAVTLFGTLMDYHGALQRYSLQIKGRYIEVRSRAKKYECNGNVVAEGRLVGKFVMEKYQI